MKIIRFRDEQLEREFKAMFAEGKLTREEYEMKMYRGNILGGTEIANNHRIAIAGLESRLNDLKEALRLSEYISLFQTEVFEGEEPVAMSIESAKWADFCTRYKASEYGGQRIGQAFYNYFNLHKMSNQDALKGLYETDGDKAMSLIRELFDFH